MVHDVKAEFIKKLEDVEVKENDCAILEVEVSSDTVNVTWHKVYKQYYFLYSYITVSSIYIYI